MCTEKELLEVIMFLLKREKVSFTGLHGTPESYPGLLLEIAHKEKFEGKEDVYTVLEEEASF